jgi:hypothetical protein
MYDVEPKPDWCDCLAVHVSDLLVIRATQSIIGSDTQWIPYLTYSRKFCVFDADASTTSRIPVLERVFFRGKSSMLLS